MPARVRILAAFSALPWPWASRAFLISCALNMRVGSPVQECGRDRGNRKAAAVGIQMRVSGDESGTLRTDLIVSPRSCTPLCARVPPQHGDRWLFLLMPASAHHASSRLEESGRPSPGCLKASRQAVGTRAGPDHVQSPA